MSRMETYQERMKRLGGKAWVFELDGRYFGTSKDGDMGFLDNETGSPVMFESEKQAKDILREFRRKVPGFFDRAVIRFAVIEDVSPN